MTGAKLTTAWLAVLFVTTRIQRNAGRGGAHQLQRTNSTNLRGLRREPVRVLLASLFWLDTRQWWPMVPAFYGLLAPAERRMGWWRWLLVGFSAHVIGTCVSQGYLSRAIRAGNAPTRLVDARDVGVSYFMLGVGGALLNYVEQPWRWRWRVGASIALAVNAAARPTFSELGHATAFGVGLVGSPLLTNHAAAPFPRRPFGIGRGNGWAAGDTTWRRTTHGAPWPGATRWSPRRVLRRVTPKR